MMTTFNDIPLTPQQIECPLAESAEGNASQKTCAYGTQEAKLAGQKRSDLTGTSRSTATKREARPALTSELGLNQEQQPAGLPAPAGLAQPIVALLDIPPADEWEELLGRAQTMCATEGEETCVEIVERVLGKRQC